MAEVSAAVAAGVIMVPLAIGATLLGILAPDRVRRDDAALLMVCNFRHGNLTTANMHVLRGMTFDSPVPTNSPGIVSGVMAGHGALAHLTFTTGEIHDTGIAHGNISISLAKDDVFSAGKGTYILVDRSENSKADTGTVAAFDTISRALLDENVDISLRDLNEILDAITGKRR